MLGRHQLLIKVSKHLFVLLLANTISALQLSYAANCNLRAAVEKHQRLDNFLEQKFDHYWYGTKPTSGFRAQRLEAIVSNLPAETGVLFYAMSTEPDFIFPNSPILEATPPQFLCVWLLDRGRPVTEVEVTLDQDGALALLNLADDIRSSLTLDDPQNGWRGPDASKRVLATMRPPNHASARPPSAVLEEATQFLLPGGILQEILSRDYRRLIVVPSRNFGSIPYAALPVDRERQLVDLLSIVVMPTFLPSASYRTEPSATRSMVSLVVGDPQVVRGDKLVRRGPDNGFVRLDGAREEAKRVAELFGVRPLLGVEATQSAVVSAAQNSDFIYFATHGVANDTDPNDRSYLLLSDGALTARKIAKLKLSRRPVVVMSACQTALGKTFESGVIGLAKAWKYAGASTVVMTTWNVYDTATRDLMIEFMTLLKNGMPVDIALQRAMQVTKGKSKYSHPIYWAGFLVYGSPNM